MWRLKAELEALGRPAYLRSQAFELFVVRGEEYQFGHVSQIIINKNNQLIPSELWLAPGDQASDSNKSDNTRGVGDPGETLATN